MEWFTNPLYQLGMGLALAVVLIALVISRRRGGGPQERLSPELRKFIKSGDFEGAARFCQINGDLEKALEFFLQAQNPARAADMAVRLERPRQAAELCERAGDVKRALTLYDQAGMKQKVAELSKKLETRAPAPPVPVVVAAPPSSDSLPGVDSGMLTPTRRVEAAQRHFDEVLAQSRNGDEAARDRLRGVGRETAEVLLAAGLMKRAAEVCRDAGLTDQAVNLFVNLLGDPASAALLLAQQGDHCRAAELFEAAGQKERALAAWVAWSREARDPLEHLPDVDRLGKAASVALLDHVVKERAAVAENLELHYRIARAYEERERPDSAASVLEGVVRVSPNFRDVPEKLRKLRLVLAPVGGGPRPSQDPTVIPLSAPPADSLELIQASEAMVMGEFNVWGAGSDPGLADAAPDRMRPPDRSVEGPGADGAGFPDGGRAAGHPDLSNLMNHDKKDQAAQASKKDKLIIKTKKENRDNLLLSDQSAAEDPALKRLVDQAAREAARQAVAQARVEGLGGPRILLSSPGAGALGPLDTPPTVLGMEERVLTLHFVRDDAVREAKGGAALDQLMSRLGRSQPRVENIDEYFRLGLGLVNAGRWLEARDVFSAIEKLRPGFRDAAARAEELAGWEKAVAQTMLRMAGPGTQEVLQRYKVLGEIGRGGMAVVYRARDLSLEREVALKFLAESATADEAMLDLFKREARAAAQLNHPHIVTIFDFGTLGGRAFICMELIKGRTVETLIQEQGRLTILEALRISLSILSALEYAHGKGIIHRDIKPSNMMQSDEGLCKLMDFGLARSVSAEGAKTTMIAGTPIYMSPEQFTGKGVDAQSDIFSFGASLYEMITGIPPFEGMARDKAPPPMRDQVPRVPALLDRLVASSMSFSKRSRLQSVRELLDPVRSMLKQVDSFIRRNDGDPSHERSVHRPRPPEARSRDVRLTRVSHGGPSPSLGQKPSRRPDAEPRATRTLARGPSSDPKK